MSHRPRILVIEDDAAIRRAVVDTLTVSGFDVDQAGRGDEGLAKALQGQVNLILLDLVLPQGSGWTILKQLRATMLRSQSSSSRPAVVSLSVSADLKQGLTITS